MSTDLDSHPVTAASDSDVCRITLVGPASRQAERSLLKLKLRSQRDWRRIVLELRIGSERCPDWYHANICMNAIKDMLKLADGFLTDEVVTALRTHMDVVSFETYSR